MPAGAHDATSMTQITEIRRHFAATWWTRSLAQNSTKMRFRMGIGRKHILYVVVRPSVVCRLSVCNVRAPYSGD